MELKKFQKNVLNDLKEYLNELSKNDNLNNVWANYWGNKDIRVGFGGVPIYKNEIENVPHVCVKVPTGGGKTFIASAALKVIFDSMPITKKKMVIWLVPSDSIYEQTLKNLSNPAHDYRIKINSDFAGKVGVYTKEQLLIGQNFSPDTINEMLTICLMSYSSLRINSSSKEIRKAYQENGYLFKFAEYFKDKSLLLADTPDTALIQIIRQLNPVVIVDESHNASSDLSIEMLKNLNPSFILDLTATPREKSNIISYVDARELKNEEMVKLPIVYYNRTSVQDVILDTIMLREKLEKTANENFEHSGEYIRPIALFQAQPNIQGTENETFIKLKEKLIGCGIPENQIAIKTSNLNELKNVNLLDKNCEIRYIVTVNALNEGWDCPFAYILSSVANKSSKVQVEQIVGRILRQPYTRKTKADWLNMSYVLSSSNDFRETINEIIKGLNEAGFSKKDCRLGSNFATENSDIEDVEIVHQITDDEVISKNQDEIESTNTEIFEINEEEIKEAINNTTDLSNVDEMLSIATTQNEEYEAINQSNDNNDWITEMQNVIKINPQFKNQINELKLPQFYFKTDSIVFDEEDQSIPLEIENLYDGFDLTKEDANIIFNELSTGEVYEIDISVAEGTPVYLQSARNDADRIREYLKSVPEEGKLNACVNTITQMLSKFDFIPDKQIKDYVNRVIGTMTKDNIDALYKQPLICKDAISNRIKELVSVYAKKKFNEWLDAGIIFSKNTYTLPESITPSETIDTLPKSLYTAEKNDMNDDELEVVESIIALDNIKWWHRIIEKKDYHINGYINHYPDFLFCTNEGTLIFVEVKGKHIFNEEQKSKLELGRRWQAANGNKYKYFMTFIGYAPEDVGAYEKNKLLEIIKTIK